MSEQDDLRDRIAEILEDDAFDWAATFQLHKASPEHVSDPGPLAASQAQAIIDRIGLTVETHAATRAKRNMTRITGAWEWDNQ